MGSEFYEPLGFKRSSIIFQIFVNINHAYYQLLIVPVLNNRTGFYYLRQYSYQLSDVGQMNYTERKTQAIKS